MKTIEQQKKSSSQNSAERRCPRYPCSSYVEALDVQTDMRIAGRVSDIAKGGCYVDTINPFAAKANVALTITKNEQSFKSSAEVVYSKIGMGMGLMFTSAEPGSTFDCWKSGLPNSAETLERRPAHHTWKLTQARWTIVASWNRKPPNATSQSWNPLC